MAGFAQKIQSRISNPSAFRRLGGDASANFLIKVFSAGLLYLSHIIMAKLLNKAEFGIYGFSIVLVAVLAQMSCLGFNETVKKFLPFYRTSDQAELEKGFFYTAISRTLLASIAVAFIGLTLLQALPALNLCTYYLAACVSMVAVPIFALTHLTENIAIARSRFVCGLAPTYLLRPILALIIFAALIWTIGDPEAHYAMVAMIIAATLAAIPQFWTILLPIREELKGKKANREKKSEWLGESLPLFLAQGIFTLAANIDVIILAFFVSEPEVALYFAAAKTVSLLAFVHSSIAGVMMRRLAESVANKDVPQFRALSRLGQWASSGITLIGALVLLLLGNWILGMFGTGYQEAYPVLAILLIGIFAQSLSGGAQEILITLGEQKLLAWIVGVTFVMNIILSIVLAQSHGILGVAIATALSTSLRAALVFMASRKSAHSKLQFS